MSSSIRQFGDYIIEEDNFLGKGQYGTVYGCHHKDQTQVGVMLAAKIMPNRFLEQKTVQREIEILNKIKDKNSQNLVRIYAVENSQEEIAIIMERCDEGDLKQQIDSKKQTGYTVDEAIRIMRQCFNGYNVLHQLNIIHRDLKPANLLLNQGNVKISDFGMGRFIEDVNKKLKLTQVGTPAFAAPQLFTGEMFSSKADIFSLGVIFYQLIYLELPFNGTNQSQIYQQLQNLKDHPFKCPQINKFNINIPIEIVSLIDKMLAYSEEDRLSLEEILQNNDFKNIQFQQSEPQQQQFNQMQISTTYPNNSPPSNIKSKKIQILTPQQNQQQSQQYQRFQTVLPIQQPLYNETMDSMTINNNFYQSKQGKLTKSQRIQKYIILLLTKGEIANQISFLLNTLQIQIDYTLKLLFQMALIGYKYVSVQNAYSFSCGQLELCSDSIFTYFNKEILLIGIEEYQKSQESDIQQMKYFVECQFEQYRVQFSDVQNQIIRIPRTSFFDPNLNNFFQLIRVQYQKESVYYHNWFKYFYNSYLKMLLPYQINCYYNRDYLKLIYLCELFINIETEYPQGKYVELDPSNIIKLDELNMRNYIKQKRNI